MARNIRRASTYSYQSDFEIVICQNSDCRLRSIEYRPEEYANLSEQELFKPALYREDYMNRIRQSFLKSQE